MLSPTDFPNDIDALQAMLIAAATGAALMALVGMLSRSHHRN